MRSLIIKRIRLRLKVEQNHVGLLDRFQEHVVQTELIHPSSLVLVGYSGGPDSTCLLHLLHRCGFKIVAAHLHHGQRDEADSELKLCQAFSEELGVLFVSGKANVPKMAKELKVGIEEAGREARYEFFRSAALQTGCDLIATAHTLDDQAETLIMNITRGTGLNGLAGIPVKRGNVVRPLLPFTRAETQAYCLQNHLWTHADPANTDLTFNRVRVRALVIPELRRINPQFDLAIRRLSAIAEEENSFLDGMAAAALEKCERPLNGKLSFLTRDLEMSFDRATLIHLPNVLLKRALRLATNCLGAKLDALECETALRLIREGKSGAVTAVGGDVVIEVTSETVGVRSLEMIQPFRHNLTTPGETLSDELRWAIQAFPHEVPQLSQNRAATEVFMNVEETKGALFFRSFKAGDEMRPLGFTGRRRVSDLMSEAGLTLAARGRVPIVCDMLGPIWIPGVCLEERVKALPKSRAIRLRFIPAEESEMYRNGAEAPSVR